MSVIEEYVKGGGLVGFAVQKLNNEIKNAIKNENHLLNVSAHAFFTGEVDKAAQLLNEALMSIIDDETHPLSILATAFIRLPVLKLMLENAVKLTELGNNKELAVYPLEIIQWSAMEIQDRYSKTQISDRHRDAANIQHNKPGGYAQKRKELQKRWYMGKYTSRNECAKMEYKNLGVSLETARKYLKGTKDPYN